MKTLWRFAKEDLIFFCGAPLFMFVSVFADLLQPTLMAQIVDVGVATHNIFYIKRMALLMLFTSVIGFIAGICSYFFSAKSTAKTGHRLRKALFSHMVSFSYQNLDEISIPSLVTRMTNDVNQVQNALLSVQRVLITVPFLLIGGFIMSIRISLFLSAIFFIAVPLLSLSIFFILSRAMKIYPKLQLKIDAINSYVRESLLGLKIIKGYHSEESKLDGFEKQNEWLYHWQLKAQKNNILLSPLIMIIFNYSMIAILWYGGLQVETGQLEVGKIMAFAAYLSQIINAVLMSSIVFMLLSRSQVSLGRISDILARPANNIMLDEKKDDCPPNPSIHLYNVSFSYSGNESEAVLRNINLSIHPYERIGIIGPTASGKSTLVSLLPRLYDATSGEILINNRPISEYSLNSLRKRIGLVQQHSILLSGSIKNNLLLAKYDASDEELSNALAQAEAHELYQYRQGAVLAQRGVDLSGGQKQRVCIARTLLLKPDVLILDDCTSALDSLTEQSIIKTLDQFKQNQTQIIISQRIAAMKHCDRIVVLTDGQIENIGTHSELLTNSDIYYSIANSQSGTEVFV